MLLIMEPPRVLPRMMEALQGHAKAGLHCKFLLITVEDKWMLDRLPTLPGLP